MADQRRGEGAPGVKRDRIGLAVWRELLASVDEALAAPVQAFASAFDRDVFDISLPPATAVAGDITADAIRAFAAMYLQAELEQAGVLIAAELLAQSRLELAIRGDAAARKLEAFAVNSRRWLTRDQRDYLFARLFGMGRADRGAGAPGLEQDRGAGAPGLEQDRGAGAPGLEKDRGGGTINQEFLRLLLALCESPQAYDEEARWTAGATGGVRAERVRVAAATLVNNLAARQYGNALIAARQINESLKAAIDLLGDPGVLQYFGARSMWDVLRKVFGELTPDIGRLVTRGQSGNGLIVWIANHHAWTTRSSGSPMPPAELKAAAAFAAQWLAASGLVKV